MTEPEAAEPPTEPDKAEAKPDDKKPAPAPKKPEAPKRKVGGKVAIELEVSRQRVITWTIVGIILGSLLLWKLGTVGQWIGVVLLVVGVYRGYQLLQTFLHKPGTIIVSEREITLPRGLCMPRPLKLQPSEITAVYFLRRSVMWNKAAPVLVVEVGEKAIAFPRYWFASEADQRHVVHALLRWSPPVREKAKDNKDREAEKPPAPKKTAAELLAEAKARPKKPARDEAKPAVEAADAAPAEPPAAEPPAAAADGEK